MLGVVLHLRRKHNLPDLCQQKGDRLPRRPADTNTD